MANFPAKYGLESHNDMETVFFTLLIYVSLPAKMPSSFLKFL